VSVGDVSVLAIHTRFLDRKIVLLLTHYVHNLIVDVLNLISSPIEYSIRLVLALIEFSIQLERRKILIAFVGVFEGLVSRVQLLVVGNQGLVATPKLVLKDILLRATELVLLVHAPIQVDWPVLCVLV